MTQLIKPIAFSEVAHFVSSTAPDPDPAYSPAATYAKDAVVDYQLQLYVSLINGNVGNTPSTSPLAWSLLGACNRHKMFDTEISTATVGTTSFEVVLTPGLINSLSLFNLTGSSLRVKMTDGEFGAVLYDRTFNLDGTIITDWYQYYFEPFVQNSAVVITDLPTYSSAWLIITISAGAGAAVGIGFCSFGTFYEIGAAQYGASAGITDYSKKLTDEFGVTTFVERAYSDTMSLLLTIDNVHIKKVQQLLKSVRATPCTWVGVSDSETFAPLTVFGWARDFRLEVSHPMASLYSLEIEGLA